MHCQYNALADPAGTARKSIATIGRRDTPTEGVTLAAAAP